MKKFYFKSLFCILSLISTLIAKGQPTAEVEYTVHYSSYGGVDLTGWVTYDIYIRFESAQSALSTVLAGTADLGAEWVIDLETSCETFQHDAAQWTVEGNSCFLQGIIPSLQWDSYFTIGNFCKNTGDATLSTLSFPSDLPLIAAWENVNNDNNFFDGGTSLHLDNTAIFRLPGDPLILPVDNRVLVARITTCGNVHFYAGIQYFPTYTGPGSDFETMLIDTTFAHPCIDFPLDHIPTVGSAGCFGDATQVSLTDGGFGPVTYSLFNSLNVLQNTYTNQSSGLVITPVPIGNYYIAMQDEAGCRDTTELFLVQEPLDITLEAIVLQGVLCDGDLTGQIQLNCSGGTGNLIVEGNGIPFTCGQLITNLPCGDYSFTATDENNCINSIDVNIACPPPINIVSNSTDIECFGDDNGTITGTATGGTGQLHAVWTYNGNPFQNSNGPSPLNIGLTGLDSGVYELTLTDDNDCSSTLSITIDEPGEYIATGTYTDASCFGFCDGSVVYLIEGGTFPYATSCAFSGGGAAVANALCSGNYTCTITDANGCSIEDEFSITQPNDITYTLSSTDITCAGACDASIDVTNVSGGTGTYGYELFPNSGTCLPPCSGNNVHYEDICTGTYSVTITDGAGCEKVISNIQINTPDPLVLLLDPTNVTCFGLANGQVEVDHTGGTEPIVLTPGNIAIPTTVTDLAPGEYTFTITDSNGCVDTEDVIITEPSLLQVNILDSTNVGCGGNCDGSINYEVTGGTIPYQYVLGPIGTSGVVNGVISNLCAFDYELLIADAFNCLDSVEFTINEPEPLNIEAFINSPTCTGMFDGAAEIHISGGTGALTLFHTPEDIEFIEEDSVTFTVPGLGESVIFLELVDEVDCVYQDSLVIVPEIITDMILNMYTSPETCWNQRDGTATMAVQNGTPPITYQWDDEYTQNTPTATGLAPNLYYTVIVTDSIGCTLSAQTFIETTLGCFFISTAITPNGDGVNDVWILGGLEYYPQCKINVYNRWGQVVFTSKGYNAQWDGTLEGETLPVADYYFVIDYDKDKDPIMGTVTIKY
jgi:gliding motility-associated-like protein